MANDILAADRRAMRYSTIAASFHWLSVVLILAQIWLGFTFKDFPKGSVERGFYFDWHKTVGVAILLVALARLAVRLMDPPPPFPEGTPDWQRMLARWTHRILYALMILLPLTGLMAVSRGGAMTSLVGGLSFPTVPDIAGLHETHEAMAWGLIVLLGIHVAGALRTQFFEGGPIAGRMPPFRAR